MDAVARELGVECCASVAIRDQLVLVGSSMASTLPTSPHIRLGQRMPFVPPLALPLMAWTEGRELDKWIGRGGEALDRDLLLQATTRVRDRGWSLVLRSDAQVRFEGAVARLPLTGATGISLVTSPQPPAHSASKDMNRSRSTLLPLTMSGSSVHRYSVKTRNRSSC